MEEAVLVSRVAHPISENSSASSECLVWLTHNPDSGTALSVANANVSTCQGLEWRAFL
jgi:hypothetical protein